MAAQFSDTVAAVCCHAGALATPFPNEYAPVPIWLVHGREDDTFKYEGESFPLDIPPFDGALFGYWSIDQVQSYLSVKNGCKDSYVSPVLDDDNMVIGTVYRGIDCENNANVEVVTLDDSGHRPMLIDDPFFKAGVSLTENLTTIDTTALAWDFLSKQSKSKECKDATGTFKLRDKKPENAEQDCKWAGKNPEKRGKRCNKKLKDASEGKKKVKDL